MRHTTPDWLVTNCTRGASWKGAPSMAGFNQAWLNQAPASCHLSLHNYISFLLCSIHTRAMGTQVWIRNVLRRLGEDTKHEKLICVIGQCRVWRKALEVVVWFICIPELRLHELQTHRHRERESVSAQTLFGAFPLTTTAFTAIAISQTAPTNLNIQTS